MKNEQPNVRTGVELIAEERQRQIEKHGWTPEHDDDHTEGDLRDAAIAYVMVCHDRAGENAAEHWPFDRESWKPSDDRVRNLVKAGALIAAEIDRLQRATGEPSQSPAQVKQPGDWVRFYQAGKLVIGEVRYVTPPASWESPDSFSLCTDVGPVKVGSVLETRVRG